MIDTTRAQDILTAVIILMRSHLSALRASRALPGPEPNVLRATRILEGAIQDLEVERQALKERNHYVEPRENLLG